MTLFLSWPPYFKDMAVKALQLFKGKRLAYIGEGYGGCTGTDEFHDLLEKAWKLDKTITIPQWFGIHDHLFIFSKRLI
jgi:hypothetical protein